MGLINRVVPDAELDSYVDDYCKRIGENAPLTMHAAKRTIEELTRSTASRISGGTTALVKECFASEDYIEGRRPSWKSAGRSSRDAEDQLASGVPPASDHERAGRPRSE